MRDKRSIHLVKSSPESPSSVTTATSYKSDKRLRLENEIFSKSIKDIENMFSFNHIKNPRLKNSSTLLSLLVKTPIREYAYDVSKLNYDCVNLSFLIFNSSLLKPPPPVILPLSKPPVILPSQSNQVILPSSKPTSVPSQHSSIPRNFELNLDDFDDDDELPMVNLERDLDLIDRMIRGGVQP